MSPARATSSLAFLAHGALAVAFAAMSVLLAVAPETVWVLVCNFHCLVAASTSVDVVCEVEFLYGAILGMCCVNRSRRLPLAGM